MELKAIITKNKEKIENFDLEKISSHLQKMQVNQQCYKTNEDLIEKTPYSKAVYSTEGKNIFINISGLNDVSEFYSYITNMGFIIKDSKIKNNKRKC